MVPADDSDIFAFMLFTHENQDLYRDIKTSMIGKKLDNRKQKKEEGGVGFVQNYFEWKMSYQKAAGRSYRWPVLQVLLQFGVVKIALSQREPDTRFLNYGCSFLSITERPVGSKMYNFGFEYPYKCPFNSSQSLTLIESIKVFGLVKMELVKFMNQLIKFERGHMTRQNRVGFKRFKDRLRERRMSSRSIKRDDDEKEMAS